MTDGDSFAAWRDAMRSDRDAAAIAMWDRFAVKLTRLAGEHLHARVLRLVTPDDILQTALRTFVRNCERSSFELSDWNGLWGLLATITVRKCIRANQRFLGPTRDVRRDHQESAPGDGQPAVELVPPSREPTGEEVVCLSDLVENLLAAMTERERSMIVLRLEGYSVGEIATRAKTSERTVERALRKARDVLERLDGESG